MPEEPRKSSLVDRISDELRRRIGSGEWPVGMRIPGEHCLSETIGVSRATVREALRGLVDAGLLEARVGDGTYVRADDELAALLLRERSPSLREVLDARAGIEATCARLAARRCDPVAIATLRAALSRRATAIQNRDEDASVRADVDFHRLLVAASDNPILVRVHAAVSSSVLQSIRETTRSPEPRVVGDAHAEVVAAIAAGDEDRAGEGVLRMISVVAEQGAPQSSSCLPHQQ